MYWEIHQILIGVHISLGIFWVGGILFIGWGVYPATRILKVTEQRAFLLSLMQRTHIIFTLAGVGVITTGVLLGTVVGPIRSFDIIWSTRYGNIWFTALIIALFTLSWGMFVGYKKTMNVLKKDSIWQLAESGKTIHLQKAMLKTAVFESVEVIGFVAIIVCMLLLR
jgi:copper resistance protein D